MADNMEEPAMFIGRKRELDMLEEAYSSKKSELVAIYGRRRIGKSALIRQYILETE